MNADLEARILEVCQEAFGGKLRLDEYCQVQKWSDAQQYEYPVAYYVEGGNEWEGWIIDMTGDEDNPMCYVGI